ncbi:MAG: sulfatase [Sedimentisphaeraceae bacterium JB056]
MTNVLNKPNVLVFMVDQMRADMIAALGNDYIKTPNIDRLCDRGTAFSNAFSPSPVCVPARCCLHYGRYPSSTGCFDNDYSMPSKSSSFMDILTDAGYRTHGIGKCHFTPDLLELRGFETREVQEEIIDDWRNDDYMNWLFSREGTKHILDPHGVRGDMYYIPQVSQQSQQLHPTNWIGQRAMSFLSERAFHPDRNWMLFCSFIHPHPPFTPPSPWHKLYRATDMPLPHINDDCEDNYTFINKFQNRYKFRDRGFDLNLVRRIRAHYFACISYIDCQIGKILDYLEQTGQIDDTLIIFTSDHGEYLGDNRCFGKRSMHDQAARIPLIASLPKVFEKGKICYEPVSLVDILPTIAAAADMDAPHDCQGKDLAKVASGNSQREVVFSEFAHDDNSICMAVSKQWKYFYSIPDQKEYFFDRINDPEESKNLAESSDFAKVKEEYRNRLLDFLRDGNRNDIVDENGFKLLPKKDMPENPDDGLIYQDQPWANEAIKEIYYDQDSYGEMNVLD